jgi:phage-related minor tail protein
MLGGQGENMLLTDALKDVGSWLGLGGAAASMGTSALIAHTGAAAVDPALSAAPSLFSGFGSWLSSLFANGDAFNAGQRIPFASGGIFDRSTNFRAFAAGDVFNDPTTMPMALLGEAGPEAIMPLRRGADGKLGLAASGGGAGGPQIVVNAPITIGQGAMGPNGQISQQHAQDLQRQLHQTLTRAAQGVLANESRPGGMVQSQR